MGGNPIFDLAALPDIKRRPVERAGLTELIGIAGIEQRIYGVWRAPHLLPCVTAQGLDASFDIQGAYGHVDLLCWIDSPRPPFLIVAAPRHGMGRLLGDGCERPRFSKLPQYGPNAGRRVAICAWRFKGARDRLAPTLSTRRDDPERHLCYVIAHSFTAASTRFGTILPLPHDGSNGRNIAKT